MQNRFSLPQNGNNSTMVLVFLLNINHLIFRITSIEYNYLDYHNVLWCTMNYGCCEHQLWTTQKQCEPLMLPGTVIWWKMDRLSTMWLGSSVGRVSALKAEGPVESRFFHPTWAPNVSGGEKISVSVILQEKSKGWKYHLIYQILIILYQYKYRIDHSDQYTPLMPIKTVNITVLIMSSIKDNT